MKILITGATGFVGRTLIPYLFSHSLTDICLLVRDRQKAESMFPGLCLEIMLRQRADGASRLSVILLMLSSIWQLSLLQEGMICP